MLKYNQLREGSSPPIRGEGPRYRWSVITLVCMCVGLVGGFLVYGGMLEILPYSFMLLIDSCTTDCTMYGIVHEIMECPLNGHCVLEDNKLWQYSKLHKEITVILSNNYQSSWLCINLDQYMCITSVCIQSHVQ
ncbi:hypothetical protein PRIPAC_84483 [Pristionchus pacificus]|uniref:Uncharacterized protein n=1 Tax=Pristionchus pacificus TaxID=54126 RepID=A0A2A6BTB1_PRIPA|nr:hypothetical protein PRIPAC_84483 [Pristionchus pacificus]|eukprot:PDM69043.1 hypothetical protein PRIPAC_47345 [Pristionchus pacificus]